MLFAAVAFIQDRKYWETAPEAVSCGIGGWDTADIVLENCQQKSKCTEFMNGSER